MLFPLEPKPTSTFNHPAVKLYREICARKPNQVQREQIAETVGDSAKAIALYQEVLIQFMFEGRPPQRVDWTLERFVQALPPPPIVSTQTEELQTPTDEEIRIALGYHGPK